MRMQLFRSFRITAQDGKNYNTKHYNLKATIAVGNKVDSPRAVQFRKWENNIIEEYTIKGFAMDDERLKNNGTVLTKQYFEEQLQRIREIWLSERKFYQKITDIYVTLIDYDKTAKSTQTFFATVRNKLHWAIHQHTAAELIVGHVDVEKKYMGLTTWKDAPQGKIQKFDVSVAKNYSTNEELNLLERYVSMYLDYAEMQAQKNIPMTMEDWAKKLDAFLQFNKQEILKDSGKVTSKIAKAFAERFDFLPFKSKKTIRLEDEIINISQNVSSVAAARIINTRIANVGKSTICNLLKKIMISINKDKVIKVCIDDFATKRRKTYGTVMVDIDTHRIIDMIDSREYNDVVTWLKTFPNLEVISRDGSITYSNAIRNAHSNAIQVSDRFHLLKNLTSYCKSLLTQHLKAKVQIGSPLLNKNVNSLVTKEESLTLFEKIEEAIKLSEAGTTNPKICKLLKMDIRTLKKYLSMSYEEQRRHFNIGIRQLRHDENVDKKEKLISEVRKMHKNGASARAISKEMKISRVTVTKYLDVNISAISGNYGITQSNTILSPYHETINQLLVEGHTFKKIEDFIRNQGYKGSSSTIRMYATRMKKLNKEAIKEATDENVEFIERRLIIKLLYKPLENVKKLSQGQLNQVLIEYPLIDKVYQVILEFRNLLKSQESSNLDIWIEKVKQLNIREINSFVNGINRDIDAVKNSITYTYSNGLAEGSVNKIKVIKRIMYGRCTFSTLRLKVLLLENYY